MNIFKRSLQKYVQNSQVGIPLGHQGQAPGNLSEDTFKVLVEAFESYSCLNQINQVGHLNTQGSYLVVQLLQPQVGWSFYSAPNSEKKQPLISKGKLQS